MRCQHRVHRVTDEFSEPHINVHTAHTELKNGEADSAIPLLREVSAVYEVPSQAELARSRNERPWTRRRASLYPEAGQRRRGRDGTGATRRANPRQF